MKRKIIIATSYWIAGSFFTIISGNPKLCLTTDNLDLLYWFTKVYLVIAVQSARQATVADPDSLYPRDIPWSIESCDCFVLDVESTSDLSPDVFVGIATHLELMIFGSHSLNRVLRPVVDLIVRKTAK